jgi:hypothetical protein
MIFNTNVNSILSKFVDVIEQLDKHASKMDDRERDKQEAAVVLTLEADAARMEKERALQIAAKMREVFSA